MENKVQTSFVSSTDVPDFSDMEIVFDVQNWKGPELWELEGIFNSDIVHESKLLENKTRFRETRSSVLYKRKLKRRILPCLRKGRDRSVIPDLSKVAGKSRKEPEFWELEKIFKNDVVHEWQLLGSRMQQKYSSSVTGRRSVGGLKRNKWYLFVCTPYTKYRI